MGEVPPRSVFMGFVVDLLSAVLYSLAPFLIDQLENCSEHRRLRHCEQSHPLKFSTLPIHPYFSPNSERDFELSTLNFQL